MCKYCDLDKIEALEQAIADNDKKHLIRVGWTEFELDEEGKKTCKQLIAQLKDLSIETNNKRDRLFVDGSWWNSFYQCREKSKGVPAFNYCPICGRKL